MYIIKNVMGNEKKLINMSKIVVNIAIYIYIFSYNVPGIHTLQEKFKK